jgi:uncharacterized protein
VTLVLDSSGLLAAIDDRQEDHVAAREALSSARGPFLLSPFVLAELEYMILTRMGRRQEVALLGEVGRDVLTLDERHFRVLKRPRDLPFRLLPADATRL